MSILITGAAGFIGSHVTERLLRRGEEIVGVDSFDDFYDPVVKDRNLEMARSHHGFTECRGDIRDPDTLASLPDSVDAIVHLAARAGVRPSVMDPVLYTDVNVVGTAALLHLARERGISSFLFASSSSVYGNDNEVPFSENARVDRPVSPYAATKRAGELLCHTASHLDGIGAMCLRLFTVYGPRQRPDLAIHKFTDLMAHGRPIPIFGDGNTVRDYTYVDDVVDGIVAALDWVRGRGGAFEIVNLGESRTVALSEMVQTIADALGVVPDIERLPMVPGDVLRTHADITKARELLGYSPNTGFADGIRQFVDWYRSTRRPLRP